MMAAARSAASRRPGARAGRGHLSSAVTVLGVPQGGREWQGRGGSAGAQEVCFTARIYTSVQSVTKGHWSGSHSSLQRPFPESAAWEGGRKDFPETQQRGSALDMWPEGAPRTRVLTQQCWGQEIALALWQFCSVSASLCSGPGECPRRGSGGCPGHLWQPLP